MNFVARSSVVQVFFSSSFQFHVCFKCNVAAKDSHGINSKRLAEVWMDEYKRLYYIHRSDLVVSKTVFDAMQ